MYVSPQDEANSHPEPEPAQDYDFGPRGSPVVAFRGLAARGTFHARRDELPPGEWSRGACQMARGASASRESCAASRLIGPDGQTFGGHTLETLSYPLGKAGSRSDPAVTGEDTDEPPPGRPNRGVHW